MVDRSVGSGNGFHHEDPIGVGPRIVECDEAWSSPDLLVTVMEPIGSELGMLDPGPSSSAI
jgi:alanine dehydrogenase